MDSQERDVTFEESQSSSLGASNDLKVEDSSVRKKRYGWNSQNSSAPSAPPADYEPSLNYSSPSYGWNINTKPVSVEPTVTKKTSGGTFSGWFGGDSEPTNAPKKSTTTKKPKTTTKMTTTTTKRPKTTTKTTTKAPKTPSFWDGFQVHINDTIHYKIGNLSTTTTRKTTTTKRTTTTRRTTTKSSEIIKKKDYNVQSSVPKNNQVIGWNTENQQLGPPITSHFGTPINTGSYQNYAPPVTHIQNNYNQPNQHFNEVPNTNPSWTSMLFSSSNSQTRNDREHRLEQQCMREWRYSCIDYSERRCYNRDSDYCRFFRGRKPTPSHNSNLMSNAILPATALIGGLTGFALAASLPLKLKNKEPLLVCGANESEQAILNINGTVFECENRGIALSCPTSTDESCNKNINCNSENMDIIGTPLNCKNGVLTSKDPIYCDSTSVVNDVSSNDTVVIMNCNYGNPPVKSTLETIPLPFQNRFEANNRLPFSCDQQVSDNNYRNVFKNGIFFYCDDKTVKMACPKIVANDMTIIDDCREQNLECEETHLVNSKAFCRKSKLYTTNDTVCDSMIKYARIQEPTLYVLNCHEAQQYDTKKLSQVWDSDTTTVAPTPIPEKASLSMSAKIHKFFLWTIGQSKVLDIPPPPTTTQKPVEQIFIQEYSKVYNESEFLMIKEVNPIIPEQFLLYGIGKSRLWLPTIMNN